jgi:hypothetical protein
VECMICNIPGRICYGSENFGLSSLHDDSVGFASDQINSKMCHTVVVY